MISGSCAVSPCSLGPSLLDVCSATTFFAFMSHLQASVNKHDEITGACERVRPIARPDHEYDFIVVGGGAGGSVVASRLSEYPHWKVLLIEAGPDEPAAMGIPGFTARYLGTKIIWNYTTTDEPKACRARNGSCPCPSGKNLAGNTGQNGLIYLRGNEGDFKRWVEAGNKGWGWDDVVPFYKKSENNGEIDRVGTKHHGTGGPLSVERFPYVPPLGRSILDAAKEAGFGVSEDLNGDQVSGFSWTQATNKKGVRSSAATAFLRPARNRKNLHVSLDSHVTRILIKNKKAYGVEYHKNGELKTVRATKEVIVSGGAMNSPQILLLSGIGPKEHLESVGVPVTLDLPGVGQNFHDHPGSILTFTINEPDTYTNNEEVAREYLDHRTGPLSATGTLQVAGTIASNMTEPDYPDVQIFTTTGWAACAPGGVGARQSDGKRQVIMNPSYVHPKSRGTVTLASNNPFDYPILRVDYLKDPHDLAAQLVAIKMGYALTQTEALKSYNFTMIPVEGCSDYELASDEYFTCVAMADNWPLYHFAGSCKMGPASDPLAVVDPRLRVHGIKGLRVADASIMPQVTSSNTQAPTMMIGERAADFISKDWHRQSSAGHFHQRD